MWQSVLTALVLASSPSRVDRHFDQGRAFYEQGDYGAAIWHFRRADAIQPTAEAAFNLSRCYDKVFDRALATYYARLYLRRNPQAPDADAVRARVQQTLREAQERSEGLLELEAFESARPTIDGRLYPSLPIAAFVPAGERRVTADFPGGTYARQVEVAKGQAVTVWLEPAPPPLFDAAAPTTLADVSDRAAPAAPAWTRQAGWGLIGVSAAALLGGLVMGGLAQADAARLERARGQLQVSEAQALAKTAGQRGAAANALWIAAGASALTGGVLLALPLPEPGVRR